MVEYVVQRYSQRLNIEQYRIILNTMNIDIQVELKGPVAEDYSFLKNRYGTETKTDTIRVIVRELARIVKEQLTPSLNINEQLDTLFYQGYFEEFLEELAEKEPKLFNEYTKQQSKPSEKGEVKA